MKNHTSNSVLFSTILFRVNRIWMIAMIGVSISYSCSTKTFDNSEQLLGHITKPESGYLFTKTVNGVGFSLLYKPTDLLVSQKLRDEPSDSLISKYRKKYKDYVYFTLSMSKNDQELLSNVAGDRQQFGALVNELAFGMEQKVHLYTERKDTIPMADYNYPRMYGMSNATSMLFVYPRNNKVLQNEYLNFTVQDLGFYTGEVKFKIPINSIKNEPTLQF